VAGKARGIEPGRQRARLDDAGDGVAGQPGVAHPGPAAPALTGWAAGAGLPAALAQRPEHRAFGDAGGLEPGAQVQERREPAPFGHGDDRARALLVGFRAPDGDPQALLVPDKVGDIERHELRAAGGERHAKGDQRPVAPGGEAGAGDGVWGASERKTDVRPCRATCRRASPLCDIHLRQKSARPAWGAVAVAELRSCATDPQSLVGQGLHRFSVRLLPRPRDGAEQLHDDVGVGGALGGGRVGARAADAGKHLGHHRAAVRPVRGEEAGALVGMGDGGERAGDGGRRQAARGEGGQMQRHQRRRRGQGRGVARAAPQREAPPVGLVGFAGGGGAARLNVAAGGGDLLVMDRRRAGQGRPAATRAGARGGWRRVGSCPDAARRAPTPPIPSGNGDSRTGNTVVEEGGRREA